MSATSHLYYMDGISSSEEEYLQVVANYIEYYRKRAKFFKYQYYVLTIIKFITLGMIPVFESIDATAGMPWIPAVASSVCLIVEAVIGLMHMKDKWILYRNTSNHLMSEQRKYLALKNGNKNADSCDAFRNFVKNVEELIGKEAEEWRTVAKASKDDIGKKA